MGAELVSLRSRSTRVLSKLHPHSVSEWSQGLLSPAHVNYTIRAQSDICGRRGPIEGRGELGSLCPSGSGVRGRQRRSEEPSFADCRRSLDQLMAPFDLEACIQQLLRKQLLHEALLREICEKTKEVLMRESNVVHISAPVTVVGDIHGFVITVPFPPPSLGRAD